MPCHGHNPSLGTMAFLPCGVCILLGCVSATLAGASSLSDMYPPLWEESPGQFSDYKQEHGKYIVDPWVYTERMGMYKILLDETAPCFEKFAPENEQNILWGLALQHGWQYKSGRLVDPSRRTNCGYESNNTCISVDSWWADINYFLSVLPFLAALDSGILEAPTAGVTLLPPPTDQTRFCYDIPGCRSSFPDIMSKWTAFFQYAQKPSSTFEGLLKYLWDAHTVSLENCMESFEDRFSYYSNEEAKFEKNWVIVVNYLAATRLPTTLIRSYTLQKGLPPRVLTNADKAPDILDFTAVQNIVLVAVNVIGDMDRSTGSSTLTIWKLLMKSQAAREQFLKSLNMLFALVP